jgi:hypothetical protein
MARQGNTDKTKPEAVAPLQLDDHLAGDIMWLGFKRHGDGKFTRYRAVTRDGKFAAVDSERSEGLASFHRDFRVAVAKALAFAMNPLVRK